MTDSRHVPEYAVFLGAVGWLHPGWAGAFYPGDLPEEWRLAYYSSHFRAVYLPRPLWSGEPEAVLQSWAEEVVPGFRFVLEGAGVALPGPAFAGVSGRDDASILWFDAATDLKRLAEQLRAPAGPSPRYLFSRDADLQRLEEISLLLGVLGL